MVLAEVLVRQGIELFAGPSHEFGSKDSTKKANGQNLPPLFCTNFTKTLSVSLHLSLFCFFMFVVTFGITTLYSVTCSVTTNRGVSTRKFFCSQPEAVTEKNIGVTEKNIGAREKFRGARGWSDLSSLCHFVVTL